MAGRTDTGSRTIRASAQAIYRAYLDPASVAAWRPPAGMAAEIYAFEAREGGGYRMAFVYLGEGQGKTSEKADVFEGRFVELAPDRRIVERVEFEAADPAFAGSMTITTTLAQVAEGVRVDVVIDNVPPGISPEDHQAGIASSLANLARFVEGAP